MGTLINKKMLIVLLLLLFVVFIGIPLVISIAYGNIPFFSNNALESSDILVSNDVNISESELSFIKNNTYTWAEIKQYLHKKEMTYTRALRNTIILISVAILAVTIDRIFLRRS